MSDIAPKHRLAVDNTSVISQLRLAAKELAETVGNFTGPDDAMISVSAGELRRLLRVIDDLESEGPDGGDWHPEEG